METEKKERINKVAFSYHTQPKEWLERCNLCGGEYFVQISQRDRYGFEAEAFACAQCGLVFLNPRMTPKAYGDFYTSVYRPLVSAYHGRSIDAKSIQAEQREYAEDRAKFAAPYVENGKGKRLLDIGGSTGVVAKYFSERFGYSGTVLDPSDEELREAEIQGLATIHGFFESAEFGEDKFDLVLLCQTVDHLLDIDLTLKKVRQCLTAHGLFFVDIVDFRAGYLRNWSVEETIKIDHPYYLVQDTIEAYLRRSGFKVMRKGYAGDHLHICYICQLDAAQSDFLPDARLVQGLLSELRSVQNAPRGTNL